MVQVFGIIVISAMLISSAGVIVMMVQLGKMFDDLMDEIKELEDKNGH